MAETNPMQLAVREFLRKHLGTDGAGYWPASTGVFNKWLLIKEEFEELSEALGLEVPTIEASQASIDTLNKYGPPSDLPRAGALVKEICDVFYVLFNLCEELHIDIQPFFDAVHKSNMTKTPAALSPTRKILKGPNYQAPNIAAQLEQYRSDQENGLVP